MPEKWKRNSPPLVVLGLGNPGPSYEFTRHNIGFRVTELLASQREVPMRRRLFSSFRSGQTPEKTLVLAEPLTYMNRSGEVLPSLFRRYSCGPENLVVVVDNLDLPPGTCRLKQGGGNAGHNGLKSIQRFLQGASFLRLFLGIGHPGRRDEVVDHVLGIPNPQEALLLEEAVVKAAQVIRDLLTLDPGTVMNELNRR